MTVLGAVGGEVRVTLSRGELVLLRDLLAYAVVGAMGGYSQAGRLIAGYTANEVAALRVKVIDALDGRPTRPAEGRG